MARNISPLRAIRKHCLDCCNGSAKAVSDCPSNGSIPDGHKSAPHARVNYGRSGSA